jgi:hypothetical protein
MNASDQANVGSLIQPDHDDREMIHNGIGQIMTTGVLKAGSFHIFSHHFIPFHVSCEKI